MKKNYFLIGLGATLLLFGGCVSQQRTAPTQEENLTVGLVQSRVFVGMSQPDVAAALGSPNIVTQDSAGRETWIYDKIASEASYSKDSAGFCLILFGVSKNNSHYTSTQRTLTVIIKFSPDRTVDTFSYHSSKF